jgi:ferritin-like metal-binding protein YciE
MLEEERAKIPPGTRLMPEEERLDTLKDLEASRKEINNALEKLPVVSKTIAMEKHKKDLENKMARIDRAIETFSKKVVYVAY